MKHNFIGQRRIQIPADKSLSSYFVDFPFAALHIFWSFMFLRPSTILLSFFCDYCSQKRLILLRLFSKIAPQFATFCTLCIKIASYQWRVIFNHFVCTVITQVTRTRNVTIGWNHKRSVDLVISCEKDKIANCRRFLEFALIIVLIKSQFPGGTGVYSLKCFPAQCWSLYCWPMRQRHKLPTCLDF